jgi:hypothetical protein
MRMGGTHSHSGGSGVEKNPGAYWEFECYCPVQPVVIHFTELAWFMSIGRNWYFY